MPLAFGRHLHLLLAAVVGLLIPATHALDWPGYRGGPEHSGIFHETGLPRSLPPQGLRILWRAELGKGYSGPAVDHGRLFVADYLSTPEPGERLLAFDASTGKPLWTHALSGVLKIRAGYENGPRATPTVEGDRVVWLSAMGHLSCLDARTGTPHWHHDLRTEYHGVQPAWGYAAAPLVYHGMVIATASGTNGASLVAFDLKNGTERWRSLNDVAGYAAPQVISVGPRKSKQLIVWTASAIHAVDPVTGQPLWHVPRKLAWDQATACPIWDPASGLLLCASDREGCLALRLESNPPSATVAWDRPTLSLLHGDAVRLNGHIYGLHHNGSDAPHCGEFRCIQIQTGELLWTDRTVTPVKLHTTAHVTYNTANRVFYITNESGELVLGEADAQGWHELGRGQINARSWSPAAFSHRRIYHRAEAKLVCAALD